MRPFPARLLLAACACLAVLAGAEGRALKDASGQACLSGFMNWLEAPCTPTTNGDVTTCCAPLVALGPGCWAEVVNAASSDPDALAAV